MSIIICRVKSKVLIGYKNKYKGHNKVIKNKGDLLWKEIFVSNAT